MKKKTILRPIALSITAGFLAVGTAYAEEVSAPVEQSSNAVASEAVAVENPEVVQVEATLKAAEEANANIKAYLGRTVTKVEIVGLDSIEQKTVAETLKVTAGNTLTEEGLAADLQAVYELGFVYNVAPEFTEVPEGVQVVYHVIENPVFKDIKIEGNTKLSDKKIAEIFDLPKEQIINLKDVNERVRKLESEYAQEGFILAKITDVRVLPSGELYVEVNEGIVEDFKIKGNTKTKDYVITREMKLKKGEPFNTKDARRSMQRIYNLGYFEDVNIKLNPGKAPNAIEVEITVVEMNTGTFGIGAGYSDADGFLGMVSLGDKNFRGTGDKINIRWEFGGDSDNNKNYEFGYMRPWLDDKETSLGFTVYDMTNEYADYDRNADEIARYDKQRRGQELTFSRRTNNEYVVNYLTFKNREDIYKGVADGYEGSDQYFEEGDKEARQKENFGKTRSIGFTRTFDSRDNISDPREGKRNSYSIEWAGLGGDFDFTKYSADFRYYYRMGASDDVIALQLGVGYADGTMPLSQRFAVGGSDTLRGYKDDQFKGNSMLRGTLEYRVPLIKKVQGVLFTDVGYAWDKKREKEDNFDLGLMKYSYGVGLRINSPLGPLRLDYGIGDDGGRFHFSFGGQF
ncbi:MAG TPA: outer membrane protein assembly factor [Candidatus Avacidaminococcus intestinavium]|uniref:Outer membrane protein assembly factor n=1 Tax=Candidatus Avacidaminococcus intestinavium TaxID=2840684 RepID=A0A9D1SKP1_9FIRM|nr:outer membrane protein assembly factor [Candidatus Avacidaminococcus intestinavium]